MAREEDQTQEGQKLRQADPTQIEHAAGHLVDLPTHGDHEHLCRNRGGKPRAEIQREVAMAQDRETPMAVGDIQDVTILKGLGNGGSRF